jgi:hypothetical protein|tara:strand:- start:1271 stop:1597 length:327 start_codon:yes stop_codon:yes gene_type:complete
MLVVIESPYKGKVKQNVAYAQKCMSDSLLRGECPFASHLLYTQVLDDTVPELRSMGMSRAFEWYRHADLMAVYIDKGISDGMKMGMEVAEKLGIEIVYRTLDGNNNRR